MPTTRILFVVASTTVALTASYFAVAQSGVQRDFKSSVLTQQKVVQTGSSVRMNRLIVKFRSEVDDKAHPLAGTSAQECIQALSARAMPNIKMDAGVSLSYLKSVSTHTHVAQTSRAMGHAELSALAQALSQDPRVEYAEVDERVYPHFVPNDPLYAAQQDNLKAPALVAGGANLPNAWGRTVGGVPVSGAGVTVAVMDTGYRPHADLAVNIVAGYDFISPDGFNDFFTANDGDGRDASALDPGDWNTQAVECDVEDSSWHGTHSAGIIGAVGNNNTGVIGVAYRAQILPVRVLGVCGGYTSDTAAAIQWAVGLTVPGVPVNPHVAKVINLSFGRAGSCSPTYQAAITAARNSGAVIVASVGNEFSRTTITQPANCTGVIAVTAHTHTGELADYANTGVGTTISAPGNNIYTTGNAGLTVPGADNYSTRSGTSFSAPQVAGVAALLMQIKPGISPAEVQTHLTSSARAFASGTYCATRTDCGAGMLDAFRAVNAVLVSQGIANAAPRLNALPTQYVLPAGSLQFTATATDAEGDEVTFNGTGLPSGATFNAVTGVFNWPKAQPAGDYTFVIQPTDGVTLGASVAVKISVNTVIPVEPVTPVIPVIPTTPAVAGGSGGGGAGWVELLLGLLLLLSARYGVEPKTGVRQSSPMPACRRPAP